MAKNDNVHITRYEFNRTNGWWVRIYRKGALKSKLFSDKSHGGKRKALLAAREWRDEVLAGYGKKGKLGGTPYRHWGD